MKRLFVRWGLFFCALLALPHAGNAQSYPDRPVRIVVPYPAGGGVDSFARAFADRLTKKWNQPVVIENKPGAGTMIGGEMVARAAPDGYTLLLTSDTSITSNPFLYKKQLLDPMKDLAPITQLVDLNQILVVHPSIEAKTLDELVEFSKRNPDKLNYGSYGKGSQPNLVFEMLKAKTGAKIMHIPFRGVAPAITGTLSNEVQMTLSGVSTASKFVNDGKMKFIVTGGRQLLAALTNVPTLAEVGLSDAEPRSWYGLFAPAKTSADIVTRIQQDFVAVLGDAEFKARYVDAAGYSVVGNNPAEFAGFIRGDLVYKKRLIETAGIEPE